MQNHNSKLKIILASGSPRRRELLSLLVKDFEIIPSNIDEEKFLKLARTPEEFVVKLAQAKGKDVVNLVTSDNTIIISADTIVVLPEKGHFQIIGKPKDNKDAREILLKLRGEKHLVLTGFCIIKLAAETQQICGYDVSTINFGTFPLEELETYVNSGKPLDKAGAYGIQEVKGKFEAEYDGSLTNIIGLPLIKIATSLQKMGVKLIPRWEEQVDKIEKQQLPS